MSKKNLTTPEFIIYRTGYALWTDIIGASKEGNGDDAAIPTRQTTDFFGNTVLVPIDDEDWE